MYALLRRVCGTATCSIASAEMQSCPTKSQDPILVGSLVCVGFRAQANDSEFMFVGCPLMDVEPSSRFSLPNSDRFSGEETFLQLEPSFNLNHPSTLNFLQQELPFNRSCPSDRTPLQTELPFEPNSHLHSRLPFCCPSVCSIAAQPVVI